METITGKFEIQYDSKPNGVVVRINDNKGQCILRVCQIPENQVYNPDGTPKQFVDVVAKQ